MTKDEFRNMVTSVTAAIVDKPLDDELARFLNERFPADGETFRAIRDACHSAIDEGWMCAHEHGGIRFGRVVKPSPETAGFSVDVVYMKDVKGPHHRHPNGEIDMIMPIADDAAFDGHGKGWFVYGPGTAHHPTVRGGDALVLYLLPDGAIEFTDR
jgi:hypothetical protein